jgi:hypothetical protein
MAASAGRSQAFGRQGRPSFAGLPADPGRLSDLSPTGVSDYRAAQRGDGIAPSWNTGCDLPLRQTWTNEAMLEQRMNAVAVREPSTKGSYFQIFVGAPDPSITSCERKIWVDLQEKSVRVVSHDEANLLPGTFRPKRHSDSALFFSCFLPTITAVSNRDWGRS